MDMSRIFSFFSFAAWRRRRIERQQHLVELREEAYWVHPFPEYAEQLHQERLRLERMTGQRGNDRAIKKMRGHLTL